MGLLRTAPEKLLAWIQVAYVQLTGMGVKIRHKYQILAPPPFPGQPAHEPALPCLIPPSLCPPPTFPNPHTDLPRPAHPPLNRLVLRQEVASAGQQDSLY